MAEPANTASPPAVAKPSKPKENGQVGEAAGVEQVAGGASEGHEANESVGGKLHRYFMPFWTFQN